MERPVIRRMISAVGVSRACESGGDGGAVLEHGHPVTDGADLLEPVGDVDDRDALGREVADDLEEPLHLTAVEHRGGLVHDDEPGVAGQRPRHAHDLLTGRRQAADLGRRRDLGVPEAGAAGRRSAPGGLGPAGEAEPRLLVPEVDVLGDRQALDEVELLVDRRDPEVHRRLGVRQLDVVAVPR